MVTIRDIARACGVSIATVSNVINNKKNVSEAMRQRVLDKMQELNYTPNSLAKNLKTKRTHTLGVIVEDITIFSIPAVVDGITEYCESHGYSVSLINLRLYKKFDDAYYFQSMYQYQLQEALKGLLADQVESIIYIAAHERPLSCLPADFPIPLVMCYAYSNTPGIPSILVEEVRTTESLVQYAISLGHKRIGVIAGKGDSSHAKERLLGYQNALFKNHIFFDPSLVCQGDWGRESGYRFTDYLLKKETTVIFCMNDIMAGGVYDRLNELGLKVGTDIGVMGYDNRDFSTYLQPPLTTVELPLHDMGYRCGEIALDLIHQGISPKIQDIYVEGSLMLRKSIPIVSGVITGL